MVATTNYKYANTSSNYYVTMVVTKFEKKFQFISHFRGTGVEAYNCEAVVVCASTS